MARRRSPTGGRVALQALTLALVIGSSLAAEEKCRTGCRGAPQTFKYVDGTTYKYEYDSKTEITLSSAENQKTFTEVKATVLLTQQPDCNQILRLQNVQIIGSDGKKYANIPDIDKPIRLNNHDGHIEDSICTVPGDTQNSLNVKRAIASLLQVNLKNGHETDVFGLCYTEVNQHKEGNVLIVQKSRNLNKCAYRESIKQDFLATSFNLNSEIKSSPILNADYSAKLRIKNGILEQAIVTETYLYVPFSVGTNGAKAVVETRLQAKGTTKDTAPVKVGQPRSVIFEDPHPVTSPTSNVNAILTAVRETAKTISVTVGENTARDFTNLIHIFRHSNKGDLLTVYNQVRAGAGFPDKVAAKKLFLDALLRAGSGDSIEVALELIKNRELSDLEQKLVYLGLSFVQHSSEGAINSAVNLLNQPTLPREAYLGIGTLAGRYCRQHSCKNLDALKKLESKLLEKIGNGKPTNRNQENDVIFVLKALANIGQLTDQAVQVVQQIAQDKKAASRLRVAALETYAADACRDKLRDSALGILKDIQQDSEIRIKAYLAVVQCPNAKAGNVIKALLENEPSYQVGGYIVSHIRNLRASANPDKELARQHLGFLNLPKRFPLDPRKWSQNTEFSYSVDTVGVANSIESNLIYSQNSFLPRSGSLNLTAQVFGHTFNFLEIDARQENLDRLVEHYFGPKGILRNKTPQQLWDSKGKHAQELVNDLKERIEKSLRSRRDVSKQEIDQIAKEVQIKTNNLNNDLDLDLSIKAFGSELLFLNINDDVKKWTPEAVIDRIVGALNQAIDKAKNFDETLRSNLLFLDAEFAYPTSSGFPLRLGVEGSANVQLKTSGAIDVRNLGKQDSLVKLSLIPSADVEVAGRLTLDALLVENGLKVISNLHTATGGDLKVELFNGNQGLDVKFSFPLEKQNLISARHDIVFHTRELGHAERNAPLKFSQNKDFSVCLDQLSPIIGLTFCADLNGPNLSGKNVPVLPFPLSGDAKVAVTIEREDVSEYHYREEVFVADNKLGSLFSIESLDKNRQKKVSLQVEAFLIPDRYFKATLVSPIKTASLEGRITTDDREISASLRFAHDSEEYLAKAGVGITGSPQRSVYRPILEYKTPEKSALQIPPYRVEGQVIAERNGPNVKYILDNVKLIADKTITVNGYVGTDQDAFSTDLTASDGSNSASVNGRLQVDPNLAKLNLEVKNTINPQANFRAKVDLSKHQSELRSLIQVVHGQDLNSKTNVLTLSNQLQLNRGGKSDYVLKTDNKLTYPLVGLDITAKLVSTARRLSYDASVQYQDVKLGSKLESRWNSKPDGLDYGVELEAWALGSRLEAKAKRQVTGDVSQIENSIEVNGKKLDVNGKIKHLFKPQDIDLGADLIVRLPTLREPIKVDAVLRYNPSDVEISHKVASGGNVHIDVHLRANKGGNANGHAKINTKQLIINGQLKASKGAGNGDIVIELPQIKRSLKADGTFTIQDPTYNVVVNIYPIFSEDKSKKITLSTQSRITLEEIDSKNLLDLIGHRFELNVKGTCQGDLSNGNVNGEADLTLPDGKYFLGKLSRSFRTQNGVINGDGLVSVEHREKKNSPGKKIALKGSVKNTNPNENLYDVSYELTAENGGQNLNAELAFKKTPQGDGSQIEYRQKIAGSLLPNPLETTLSGNCKGGLAGNYNLRTTYGPNNALSVQGKYDIIGNDKPISGDINLQLATTSAFLRSLKIQGSGSALKSDRIQLQGSGSLYADSPDGLLVDLKGSGEVRASDKDGRIKASLTTQKGPLAIDAGFSRNEDKNKQQLRADGAIKYGQNKNIKVDATVVRLPNEYKLDLKLESPTEKFRSNRLQVHTKHSDDNTNHESEVIFTSDGKKWTSNTVLVVSEVTPSIDVRVRCPEGKLSQVSARLNKISDKQIEGELKIVDQRRDFILEGAVEANFESIDDFHVKIGAHCPALQLEKILLEAQSKPAKTGRRVQVTAKSAGKNILQGSTSYTTREEKGKTIVEGSGSFKVKDETKSANFKYIRQNLSQEKNGENGVEISFDASLGNKAIDAEFKLTNKQFRILNSYCEEKKQCAHVEIDSKTVADDIANFNQEIEIAVDLRKLGLSHEFGLKAVTTRKEWLLDHTVDVHFQSQANSKYQYSLYLHPTEAGVSLTTPKRIVALEAVAQIPKEIKDGGRASAEVVFYLDKKNQPDQKSSLAAWINVNAKNLVGEGEIKFTNPALKRPLVISTNVRGVASPQGSLNLRTLNVRTVIDVFAQPSQKIIVTYEGVVPNNAEDVNRYTTSDVLDIKSAGLGIDIHADLVENINLRPYSYKATSSVKYQVGNSRYNSAYQSEISPEQLFLLVRVLNIDLLKASSRLNLNRDQQVVDSELSVYGTKPIASHLEVKNWNTLKYTVNRKDNPNEKLQVNAGLIPGQIADFRAEVIQGDSNYYLVRATVKLDEADFLKSSYDVHSGNIENFVLIPTKNEIANQAKELKNVAETLTKDLQREAENVRAIVQKATPNLAPIRDYYATELNKIKEEILSDKTIQEISELAQNIVKAFAEAFGDILRSFSELVEVIVSNVTKIVSTVLEIVETDLAPQLREIAQRLVDVALETLSKITEVVLAYVAKVTKIVEQYQPELQQLGASISEITQDVVRVLVKAYEGATRVIVEQWNVLYSEIKALPIFDDLKAQLETIFEDLTPSPEALINTLRDVTSTIKDLVPIDEIKRVLDAIEQYIEKKLLNKPVDDVQALEQILRFILEAVRKLVQIAESEAGTVTPQDWQEKLVLPGGLPANLWSKLPRIAATRFSPVAYFIRGDYPDVSALLLSLVNTPRNLVVPFPLYGLIAQGQHIFTFDGKHLTFPGKCNYLLARDAVDGNFTVVGTYTDGILTAITLAEGRDTVTLKKGGQVLLNNAVADLPARKPNLAAYRDYERVVLVTDAGIKVVCGPELVVCSVTASGFYHGKLRGLLGNGNNEPYDDLTLANGKIVTNAESDFANSYKLSGGGASSCPQVKALDHHAHHGQPQAKSCDKLFGWDSELRYCYPFVNNENFKTACVHGVGSGVPDTEYAIATAYVAACNQHGIPLRKPAQFVKCTNSETPFKVGEEFSVKTPGKSADIVLLVDTDQKMEPIYKEYVQPLVQQLTQELQSKGISDTQFHLIAYGGENRWPSHTTVGGKLTFSGRAPNLKFSESPQDASLKVGCEKIDSVLEYLRGFGHDLELGLGLDLQARTYDAALRYPFRANAVKTVIAVTGKPCEVGLFYPLQVLRTLLYRGKAINLNLITPFERLTIRDTKQSKDIVGFNDENVFTLGQSKGGRSKQNAELYKELNYDDFCVDFTIQNRGNVFVTNNFQQTKGATRKQFVQVTSNSIVEQLLGEEQRLDCECRYVTPFSAQNVCKVVGITEKQQAGRKVATKS